MNLIVFGLGYTARVSVSRLRPELNAVWATTRSPAKAARIAADGITPLLFDGAAPGAGVAAALREASHILVSAGPDAAGDPVLRQHADDIRAAAGSLRWIGYLSTIGVYGDTDGGWIDETAPASAVSARARWRVGAEEAWVKLGAEIGVPVALLRLGGIYGPGRNPFVNLSQGSAKRVVKPGQVFNRIHVDDIAAVVAAAARQRASGVFNVVDDEPAPPQDVIEHAAGLMGWPVPPDVPFDAADLSEMARSFYADNRRVGNGRLKTDLGVSLAYPSYRDGLAALMVADAWKGSDLDRDEASPKFRRG